MDLRKRINKLEEIKAQKFSDDVANLSDEALEEISRECAAITPNWSAAFNKLIKSLSDKELEAFRYGKTWLLSAETKMRLNDVNKIKN